jgi:hypothetical protein
MLPHKDQEIVQERRARSTGTLVQVVDNRNGCIDDDPTIPWFTICVDHGGCVGHPTRKIAIDWAAAPEEWCPTCRGDEPAEPL